MFGLLEGSTASGFGALLSGPPEHPFSFLLLVVRRLEVFLLYNTMVTIPMVVALYYHFFPSPGEVGLMHCACGSRASAKRQANESPHGVPRGSA